MIMKSAFGLFELLLHNLVGFFWFEVCDLFEADSLPCWGVCTVCSKRGFKLNLTSLECWVMLGKHSSFLAVDVYGPSMCQE